jgi:hypothetical protein
MRLSSWLSLALLCSATAAAHGESFRAAWAQPLAPLVAHNLIVPVGLTHGLALGTDLVLEITPYTMQSLTELSAPDAGIGACAADVCFRRDGLIATAGLAFGQPFLSGEGWEMGAFLGLKALVAAAAALGGDRGFPSGVSFELGGGIDVGIELHAEGTGLYVAFLIGMQVTTAFSSGPTIIPAASPLLGLFSTRLPGPMASPNANLFRVGWAF